MLSHNQEAFLALVRAGLWENEVRLSSYKDIDYSAISRFADEQTVIGLVAAGLEHVIDVKVSQEYILTFIGRVLQVEQRNRAMNEFIGSVVEEMRNNGIYTLLVKGQGLAQCYERPLWRVCGDIDFFFSESEFYKAADFFIKLKKAKEVQNASYTKSFGVIIEPWFIELHGTLRNGLSSKMDREIDDVQYDLFYGGNVRSWQNGNTQVLLPGVDDDVFLVFVHFIRHFYKEGVCLRQLCDWCRLMWTYQELINVKMLESRIEKAGLMTEWKSFAALLVDYLGMPKGDMLLYEDETQWHRKGDK